MNNMNNLMMDRLETVVEDNNIHSDSSTLKHHQTQQQEPSDHSLLQYTLTPPQDPIDDQTYRVKSEKLCWGIVGSVLVSLAIGSILLYAYRNEIPNIITNKTSNKWDIWVIIFFLAFLGTQPMFPGLTLIYILAGFALGWWGFLILYVATVLGGWCTFLMSKELVKRNYLSWDAVYLRFESFETYIRAVEKAVSERSYKAALLLQLSGSPYGLLNMLLALTNITFPQFVIATLVSRLKLIQYISLGVSITSIIEVSRLGSSFFNVDNVTYLTISVLSFTLSSIAVIYVYYYAKKELKLMRPRPPTVVSVLDTDHRPHAVSH